MGSQYDFLAKISEASAEAPVRKYFEEHTLMQAVGDVEGKSVLDLGCGTGLYSRRFKRRGAARVVGVDVSEGMVAYARHVESQEPLGIEYVVSDAAEAAALGTFDVIVATYLLHYSPNREVLGSLCKAIRAALAPGGRFTSLCMSPDAVLTDPPYYRKYGIELESRGQEGDEITLRVLMPGMPPANVTAYHWTRATYEAALREAGFDHVTWHAGEVAFEGVAKLGEEYWREYLARPHAAVFTCSG